MAIFIKCENCKHCKSISKISSVIVKNKLENKCIKHVFTKAAVYKINTKQFPTLDGINNII